MPNISKKLVALSIGISALVPSVALAHNYAGETCQIGIRDELKCMVCTLFFEARPTSFDGMLAVGRVVMERVESRQYPDNICDVVYQRHQFVGLNGTRRLSDDHDIMDGVVQAARSAIAQGGSGFLGFRTCNGGDNHVAGNCFRRTGDADSIFDRMLYPGTIEGEIQLAADPNYQFTYDDEVEAVVATEFYNGLNGRQTGFAKRPRDK